jgi:hypothetical protein
MRQPHDDFAFETRDYRPKYVLLMSLPGAVLLGLIAVHLMNTFGRIPSLPLPTLRIQGLTADILVLLLSPVSACTSSWASNYLSRFAKRDFAMKVLLGFNVAARLISAVVASLLVLGFAMTLIIMALS